MAASDQAMNDALDIDALRAELDQAFWHLQSARDVLTAAGLTEWSAYLGVDAERVAVWVQPDGILDCFARGGGDG